MFVLVTDYQFVVNLQFFDKFLLEFTLFHCGSDKNSL